MLGIHIAAFHFQVFINCVLQYLARMENRSNEIREDTDHLYLESINKINETAQKLFETVQKSSRISSLYIAYSARMLLRITSRNLIDHSSPIHNNYVFLFILGNIVLLQGSQCCHSFHLAHS